jgi:hypothetical protein
LKPLSKVSFEIPLTPASIKEAFFMTFRFLVTPKLKAIVAHAMTSKKWHGAYGSKVSEPTLYLVKDQGTYLMSAGVPGLHEKRRSPNGKHMIEGHVVAYAVGHDPVTDEDWWIGGDDYAINVPCLEIKRAINKGVSLLEINVD